MKLTFSLSFATAAILLTGCHPENMQRISGYPKPPPIADEERSPNFDLNSNLSTNQTDGIPLPDPKDRASWTRDHQIFKKDTVYFDFDSSSVKPGEKKKVAAVAEYLKSHPENAVEVDGHCDERGTEEYNRSLGERRALALREELARDGVNPMLIDTVSYGKDRPAMPGHDETAYRKNRRGEFLLETAPNKSQ